MGDERRDEKCSELSRDLHNNASSSGTAFEWRLAVNSSRSLSRLWSRLTWLHFASVSPRERRRHSVRSTAERETTARIALRQLELVAERRSLLLELSWHETTYRKLAYAHVHMRDLWFSFAHLYRDFISLLSFKANCFGNIRFSSTRCIVRIQRKELFFMYILLLYEMQSTGRLEKCQNKISYVLIDSSACWAYGCKKSYERNVQPTGLRKLYSVYGIDFPHLE